MPFTGDKYVGDLALYYIAKKLESGQKKGSVKDAIDQSNIDAQLKGGLKVNTQTDTVIDDDKMGIGVRTATKFNKTEIETAIHLADSFLGLPDKKVSNVNVSKAKNSLEGVKNIEKVVEQFAGPNEVTFDFAPNKPVEVVIQDSKGAKDPVYTGVTFDFAPGRDPQDVIAEAKLAVEAGVPASFDVPQTTVEELGFVPGTPTDPISKPISAPTPTPTPTPTPSSTPSPTPSPETSGDPQIKEPPQGGIQTVDLLNAPDGAYIWNVDGNLYVAYEVPGARGEVYDGPPMFMAYTVPGNNLVEAGLLSPEAPAPFISQLLKEDFDAVTILQSGNTDQLTSLIDHPFASFAEQLESQIAVAPWLEETEAIGLLAEAALEGREVTDAEWQGTNWWKTHSDSERDWLITYNSDPATAQQLTTDAQLAVANSLQAAGVSNAPEAIINWVADKYISGQWSQAYTTEQVSLFADPYATGKRDENFENYLSSTAITGVDRTSERELEVKELYAKWLGPTLGKLTSEEVSEIAGQLRDDPEYKDSLIQNLKQNRLAAFSAYTNPELTYEDIARPWRNLTTSVWGQTADETQGWWQEMVKTNDFAKAQETLREKGIEQDITQVTQDATKALQQALGQGQVSQSGVNV